MRKQIELPIKEIVKKYEDGNSPLDISKDYNVGRTTILNRLNKYYQKEGRERPKVEYKKKDNKIELPMDKIIKEYEEKISTTDLAKEYGVSDATIRARIRRYYEEIGRSRIKNITGPKKKKISIDEIIKRYEKGIEIKEIAKEYNVVYSTIRTRVSDYYKNKGKEKPKTNSFKKQQLREHIIKEYENGKKQTYLAKKYGISKSTISKIIQKYYLENELKVHKKKEIPVENKEKRQKEPKKLRSATVIVEYLKKGLTIQEILETASKKNVIISQEIINTALNKVNNKKINDNNEER